MTILNDYELKLSEEDYLRFNKIIGSKFKDLAFENIAFLHSLRDVLDGSSNIEHWKNEFNFKLVHVELNYIRTLNYLEKLRGRDIYEEHTDENIGFHFWFSDELETLLFRLLSLLDNLNHIINFKYKLIDPSKPKLITAKNIVRRLSEKNSDLAQYLLDISEDSRYKNAQQLRNNMTHNHSPLNITEGVERYEENGKIKGAILSSGEYETPSETMHVVDEFIDVLKEILDEVKQYL